MGFAALAEWEREADRPRGVRPGRQLGRCFELHVRGCIALARANQSEEPSLIMTSIGSQIICDALDNAMLGIWFNVDIIGRSYH